jgi:outer membrane protein OmpA-like peptidoglycan-associated protein
MKKEPGIISMLIGCLFLLTSCSFNPFVTNKNQMTGSVTGTAIGAIAGAGGAALLGAPKYAIGLAGLGGGMLGYYATTLRFDAGGIIQSGGQVYQVGDYIGIYIPARNLFEPHSAELLPQSSSILDSVAAVLQRYPHNNILISGNTSGFSRSKWEQKLSQERAKAVAAYLWNSGINQFQGTMMDSRRLNYVGYGDYFPIADNITFDGIDANNRIQITSYPSTADLKLDKKSMAMHNIASMKDEF